MHYPISEYFSRINVYPSLDLSDDGKRFAYQTSVTGVPQIWLGAVPEKDGLMSYPKPLTTSKVEQPHALVMGTSALQFFGNDRLLAMMDSHGDEQTYIKIFDLKSGAESQIPRAKGARDYMGFTEKSGKRHFFMSNRGHLQAQGLFTYDFKSGEVEEWYHHPSQGCAWVGPNIWKGKVLFVRTVSNSANTLHAIDPKTKEVTDLFVDDRTMISPVGVMADNKILVVTTYERQFASLAWFNPKDKTFKVFGSEKWDVQDAQLSKNKKTLIVNRNVAGRSELEIYAWPSMKRQKVSFKSDGVVENIAISGSSKFAVFGYLSPQEPRNFYFLNLKTRKVHALTDNWTSKIPKSELVLPQIVKYKSGEREVHSLFFLPKGAKKNRSTPVIVWPHGGPQAQERPGFRPIFQYFVGRGFAVWAPNHTGSTGYGKDFTEAIVGQWGMADLPDMKNGIDWLKASGWIDEKRMAIMGGSYGGFMTLRTLTKMPGVFKAGVDIFGVSNLLTFIESMPPDWKPYIGKFVGDPEKDRDKLIEQSPINTIEKVDCPLLVVQGAKDPRVVKEESDQVVDRLRKAGREVEYLVFEDEGHGFLKTENELKAYTTIAEFLEKHF